jgi:hypothetical protein
MNRPLGFTQITFKRPFELRGVPDIQPAGTYSIEVRDDRLGWGWLKCLGSPLRSIWIRINRNHGIDGELTIHRVSERALSEALYRDAAVRDRVPDTDVDVLAGQAKRFQHDRSHATQIRETAIEAKPNL